MLLKEKTEMQEELRRRVLHFGLRALRILKRPWATLTSMDVQRAMLDLKAIQKNLDLFLETK